MKDIQSTVYFALVSCDTFGYKIDYFEFIKLISNV